MFFLISRCYFIGLKPMWSTFSISASTDLFCPFPSHLNCFSVIFSSCIYSNSFNTILKQHNVLLLGNNLALAHITCREWSIFGVLKSFMLICRQSNIALPFLRLGNKKLASDKLHIRQKNAIKYIFLLSKTHTVIWNLTDKSSFR